MELQKTGANNDHRKESRKPQLDNLAILGKPLPTNDKWFERRQIIDKLPHLTLKEYQELYTVDGTSLGVVRPTRILDMKIEKITATWDDKQEAILSQQRLFGQNPKSLAKIPYKFSYVFECEDSDKPHNAMCEDWELGVLFIKEKARLGSDEEAAESVRNKFLNDLCAPNKDTRFFMGTIFPFNTWVVLGVFYPPRIKDDNTPKQMNMFD